MGKALNLQQTNNIQHVKGASIILYKHQQSPLIFYCLFCGINKTFPGRNILLGINLIMQTLDV